MMTKAFKLIPRLAPAVAFAVAALSSSAPTLAQAPTLADEPLEPVLLVHGWQGAPADMADMAAAFEAAGYPTYVAALPGQNNITNANALATLVNAAKSETGAAKVHLVGHSMGGLSTRHYIKRLGGAANVRSYVAFGTPQYGFGLACLLGQNDGGQMCPSSSFLRDLNAGDDTPGTAAYATFRSSRDTPDITRLDGGACFFEIPDVDHADEPKSPAFIDAVLATVGGACPGTFTNLPIQ